MEQGAEAVALPQRAFASSGLRRVDVVLTATLYYASQIGFTSCFETRRPVNIARMLLVTTETFTTRQVVLWSSFDDDYAGAFAQLHETRCGTSRLTWST